MRHDQSNVSYGDNVRIRRTAETERLGIADMVGNVYGETTPSESKVQVIGTPEVDYALNVYFDTMDSSYWLAPQLLEFVNHAPGTEVHVHGSPFKSVRQPDGTWKEIPVNPVRQSRPGMFKTACRIAIAGALLLVWLSLGVGIIGKDGDPSNRMYLGVLCVGIVGSLLARFRPQGMARALSCNCARASGRDRDCPGRRPGPTVERPARARAAERVLRRTLHRFRLVVQSSGPGGRQLTSKRPGDQ